jgi:hypothetical protein
LGEVFGISDVDSENGLIEVTLRLIALRKLFDETISALEEIPNIKDELYIAPIRRLSKIVKWATYSSSHFEYLSKSFQNYKTLLSTSDLTSLDFAENVIEFDGRFNERIIDEKEIKAILDELSNLYDSIHKSTLPIELIESLLELIIEMRRSAGEYSIRGAKALSRALTKSIGVLAVNKGLIKKYEDTPEIQQLKKSLERIENANDSAAEKRWKGLLNAASSILPNIK